MYLPCLALLAISVLAESNIDFSKPVGPFVYQQALQQGFDSNYFKHGKWANIPVWYKRQHIQDMYNKGFRNFRIRINMEAYGGSSNYDEMLEKVEEIVDDCIDIGVLPVVTWRHQEAEAYATEDQLQNYLAFWRDMAEQFKNTSYHLSFNLIEELGHEICSDGCSRRNKNVCCSESLTVNKDKYHRWTSEVIKVIRGTGGNNENRILILTSPEKTEEGLKFLNRNLYPHYDYLVSDSYLMVEWHNLAAGPSLTSRKRRWTGDGTEQQKERIRESFRVAEKFTNDTQIPTYCGEWFAIDNQKGKVLESSAIAFARFFVSVLKANQIPWSTNQLETFYDTKNEIGDGWREVLIHRARSTGKITMLNMRRILDAIIEEM